VFVPTGACELVHVPEAVAPVPGDRETSHRNVAAVLIDTEPLGAVVPLAAVTVTV
jgi:hypothetical protein